jgi:hypothetical protein
MKWISLKERFPTEDKKYLCWNGNLNALFFNVKEKAFYSGKFKDLTIKFWMEMPEPPIEE